MSTNEALITITLIAGGTLFTRVIPFLVFPAKKKTPEYITYLGSVLPYAIIGMLVIYCLKSVSLLQYPYAIPEGISIAFVIAIHRLKHNLLLSIAGSTLLYMILIQMVF